MYRQLLEQLEQEKSNLRINRKGGSSSQNHRPHYEQDEDDDDDDNIAAAAAFDQQTSIKTQQQQQQQLSEQEYRLLRGIYYNLSHPGAFGGAARLQKYSGLSLKKCREFLESSKVWTKFKQRRSKYSRLSVKSLGLNHVWSIDVAYMDKLASENKGVTYLLVSVDALSRYLRVQPMVSKSASSCLEAFKKMLKPQDPSQNPVKLWSDQGTEFGGEFKKFCKENDIQIYHTYSESKSCLAERYIRTLKAILYKFFEHTGSTKYIHVLQKFVKTINNRVNSSIGMAPNDVTAKDVQFLVEKTQPMAYKKWEYKKQQIKGLSNKKGNTTATTKFLKGQKVRIASKDLPFKKGYRQKFTSEVFTIVSVQQPQAPGDPVTYELEDRHGQEILGRFYQEELVRFKYNTDRHRARHQTIIYS